MRLKLAFHIRGTVIPVALFTAIACNAGAALARVSRARRNNTLDDTGGTPVLSPCLYLSSISILS
jgi:hypothetical protein